MQERQLVERLKASVLVVDEPLPKVGFLDLIYIAKVVDESVLATLLERIRSEAIAIEVGPS